MVYPSRGNVMRPEHIGKRSTEMINRTYINNCYFWIYDLEEDNSFFNDPAQWKYLKSVLLLAKRVRPALAGFAFRDTNGIVSCDDGLSARLYQNGDAYVLRVCFGERRTEIYHPRLRGADPRSRKRSTATSRPSRSPATKDLPHAAAGKAGRDMAP